MASARRSFRVKYGVGAYRLWWWLPLLLALLLIAPSPARAQTPAAHDSAEASAAIVVDDREGDPNYIVVAYDDDVSALDLLRMSDVPLVTVEFGGLGEGVCRIVETGCDVSACRRRLCQTGDPESPFWQLWQQGDDGTWSMSTLGGSHSPVEDGDIMAWVWTGVEPDLLALRWDEVAELTGAPEPVVNREGSRPIGVWMSDQPLESGDEGQPLTGTLISTGILAGLAGVGLLLIRRRRTRTARPTS